MFYCEKCGFVFNKPRKIYERHSLDTPPFEELQVCPNCSSEKIHEKMVTHCRCCGARITNSKFGYCSERCRERGEKLYALEQKRRQIREESPISEIVRQVKKYNAANNTNYSYGQYVALIMAKENGKCKSSKKNI